MRFFYGLPFALAWLLIAWLAITPGQPLPGITASFLVWTVIASLTQIAATALLLRCMEERNFALGVAYAKTDVIQVALFGFVLLGDRVGVVALAAILVATAGVVLISLSSGARSVAAVAQGWTSRAAMLGLGSGAAFAMAGYSGSGLLIALPFSMPPEIVVPGLINRLFVFLAQFLPNATVSGLVRFINRQRGQSHT